MSNELHSDATNMISTLSREINFSQKHIDKLTKTKESQMQELEDKKRKLKQDAGSGMPAPILQQNIRGLMENNSNLLEQINKLMNEAVNKKNIDLINEAVTIIDREISRIQEDRDKGVLELQEKIENIKSNLNSIIEVDEMVSELEAKMVREIEEFNKEIELTKAIKIELNKREDAHTLEVQSQIHKVYVQLEELDIRHMQDIEFIQTQKMDIEIELKAMLENVGKTVKDLFVGDTENDIEEIKSLGAIKRLEEIKSLEAINRPEEIKRLEAIKRPEEINRLEEIKRLEELKLHTSTSKQSALDRAISLQRSKIAEDEFRQNMPITEEINEFLKQNGLVMFENGEIRFADGKVLTTALAQENGLLDELDKYLVESYGLHYNDLSRMVAQGGKVPTRKEAKKLALLQKSDLAHTQMHANNSIRSDLSSRDSDFLSMDAFYLKKNLGVPLTLALAEITAKQPKDPIHYLGHWLFKYRYNQEVEQQTKQKVEELTSVRSKIAKEKWDKFLEEEARNAVLEIIKRAETEGDENEFKREMQRIVDESEAMENEEDHDALEEEARDTLGEYNGPTVNQRASNRTQN